MKTTRITTEQARQHMADCLEGEDPRREIKAWKRLEKKLLAMGGLGVARQGRDPYAARLLDRGVVFDLPVRLVRGKKRECHANAADLWARAPDRRRLVTGYARLCGGWVAHSWV